MEMEERWKRELANKIYNHIESTMTECEERLKGMKVENVAEYKVLVDLALRKTMRKYGDKMEETRKRLLKGWIEEDLEIVAENAGLWRHFTAVDSDGDEYEDKVLEDPPQKQKPTLNQNSVTTTAVIEHQHNAKNSPAKQITAPAAKQPSPSTARRTPSSPANKKTGENQQISKTNAANNNKQDNTNPDMSITIEDDDDDDTVEAASPEPKKLKQTTLTASQTKRTVKEIPTTGNRPKGLGNKK